MKVKQFAWAKTLQEYDFCVLFTAALVRGRKKKKSDLIYSSFKF